VGSDGKVNVTITLRLTEREEQQFLDVLDDLGERATPLIFGAVLQATRTRKKGVRYETQSFQARA
jgi:hypothetical protein